MERGNNEKKNAKKIVTWKKYPKFKYRSNISNSSIKPKQNIMLRVRRGIYFINLFQKQVL